MYTVLKAGGGLYSHTGVKLFQYFRNRSKLSKYFFALLGFFVVAVLWNGYSIVKASPAIPTVGDIMQMVFYLIRDGPFLLHITASMQIILLGIGAAACIGFTSGILIFRYPKLKAAVMPIVESIRGIAALTLFPLIVVVFGIGHFPRAFIIFWTAWPAIILSTIHSLEVDGSIIDAARVYGAGEWTIITHIRIPMALQGLITGLRIGVGGGWISLIAAEMLGASRGLGFYLLWSSQSFEFSKVYACIFIIAAIGGLMNLFLIFLQKKAKKLTGDTK